MDIKHIINKLYCENNEVDLFSNYNAHLTEKPKIKERIILEKPRNLADLFIENDRKYFTNKQIEEILNFVKNNNLLELKK